MSRKSYHQVLVWHQIVKAVAIVSLSIIGVSGVYFINNPSIQVNQNAR
ncbi:hypothetical protein IQ264_28615 [Phormidium sp. LEGE 05292]|nr:hypothetical protein [Phormidium sp. LEGE 05292]MBE9229372.1 hypothetical protein [Phormidium sp. LEGE 05292]